MFITRLFREFFDSEKSGGIILVFATIISIVISNSAFQDGYLKIWSAVIADHTIVHWINEGLMAVFFLLIGLELEREFYVGELKNLRKASLPVFAAIGGMVMPAFFFLIFNKGTEFQRGSGIPTATDIAFAIGILSLLGKRVPGSFKIFLTALAVIDDLGAIIIIAIFYSGEISLLHLSIALAIFGLLIVLNRLRADSLILYVLGGIMMWYFMLHSGVHAAISGVMLAFAIPFRAKGSRKSPSYILQHALHKPVAFFILPVFALANTSISFTDIELSGLGQSYTIGIIAGLIIGKPLGIWLFSSMAVRAGIASYPGDINWKNIIGAGFLGGIGFTMSIFITLLAFTDITVINYSKLAILIASFIAGSLGYTILRTTFRKSFT